MRTVLKVLTGLGVIIGGALLIGSASISPVSSTSNAMLLSAEEFARVHRLEATLNSMNGTSIVIPILALLLPMAWVALRRMPRVARSPILTAGAMLSGALLLVIALGAANQSALAFGSYGSLVPNYGASSVTNPNGTNCNVCHAVGGSLSASTPFKTAFANAGHVWTVAEAQTDSDSDGFSNGEELQDPNGATVGTTATADPYGDTIFLSSPGIAVATFVNNTPGFGTRGYPIAPVVTAMSPANGQTIAGSLVVSASIRYAGLSKEVWTVTNSGGSVIYTSTINYAPLTGTNYNNKHCLGANAPTTACAAWNTTAVPNGNYTIMVTAYDRRAVSLGGPQTNSLSRSVTINNVIVTDANLSINKTASSASVLVGSPLTYTLVVANAGPLAASNVKVTDTLPANVTFSSVSSTAGTCTGTTTVVCSISSLANGSSGTVTLVVAAASAGNASNTASVAASQPDPNMANNSSSASTSIGVPAADVSIAKSASGSTVLVNTPFTYTIVVRNNGPQAATSVVMTDVLPAGLSLLSSTTTMGTCTGSTMIACMIGTLANGGTASVSIGVTAAQTGTVNNKAQASADQNDSNLANNQSSASVMVVQAGVPAADVSIAKSASGSTVLVNTPFTYTILVRNNGPQAATSVVMTDALPASLSLLSTATTLGTCSGSTMIACMIGTLANGETASVSIGVTAAQTGTVNNKAQASADQNDSNLANNQSFASVMVVQAGVPAADVSIVKSASGSTVLVNTRFTYTIVVRNNGPQAATNVVMTDALPARLSLLSTATTLGTCSGSTTVVCMFSSLSNGGTASVSIGVTAAQTGTVNNKAQVTAGENDSNLANNQSSASVMVVQAGVPRPHPRLRGSRKSASQYHLNNGEVLTYTIKLNNSGTADASVNVIDPVPDGLSYLPGTANHGGVYDPGTRTVTWSAIGVPYDGRVRLSFAVTPTLVVTRSKRIVNTATIVVAGDGTFTRSTQIDLRPRSEEDDDDDDDVPEVHHLTIGNEDVVTNRSVMLHVAAVDNFPVRSMYLREWVLDTGPAPHWTAIRSSGWIPYQADYRWTLANTSGVHFVTTWVADVGGYVSQVDSNSEDFASLMLPNATVSRHDMVPYLVYFPAGVNVKATLATLHGDADLYVWYPGNIASPDQASTNTSRSGDSVAFTTPRAGVYLFVVHGYAAATYNLHVTPNGGPQAIPIPHAPSALAQAAPAGPFNVAGRPGGLTTEPVLTQSGVDPLADAVDPSGPYLMYLPLIIR